MQDEIALGLVRALQLEVASSVFAGARSSPRTAEANDSYLRGLHVRDRFDRRGFEESIADFRRALELDPAFVPAAEALALSLRDMSEWGFVAPGTGFTQARAASEAALKLDPKSAVAHALLCVIDTEYDWDWSAAARECGAAESLTPHHPFVLIAAALQRTAVGAWSEAAYYIEAAGAADPLDPRIGDIAGVVYLRAGRITEAEIALRRSLEISPTFVWDHFYLGTALLMEGRANEALTEMQQETGHGAQAAGMAVVYHVLHRDRDSDAALARLEAENAGDSAMLIAEAYAVRGQKDQAFKWLDRAFTQKDDSLSYFKGDPLLQKSLASDPRYKAFLRKMNLPE
jgi:serine/threonine-protein kinase